MSVEPIAAPDPTKPAGTASARGHAWFCPLRALVFAHLVATLLTSSAESFRRIGERLSGDYFWYTSHLDAYRAFEDVGSFAFLTVFVFPPAIVWLARRRHVQGREFVWLMLATLGLACVQWLAIVPAVQ